MGLLLLAGGLGLQCVLARSPEMVEPVFARGVYPLLGGRLGCLARLVPISLGEAIVFALLGWLTVALWRLTRSRERRPRLRRLARAVLPAAGTLYLAFLLLWGLNYQRQPFAVSAGLEVRPSSLDELAALGAILVDEANEAREGLPEDGAGVMRLADGKLPALARTEAGFRRAASLYPVLAGCPSGSKPLLTSTVFSWLGVTGIYFPFTGEPMFNVTLPDPELPFAAAHEIAHQRGFAREDEGRERPRRPRPQGRGAPGGSAVGGRAPRPRRPRGLGRALPRARRTGLPARQRRLPAQPGRGPGRSELRPGGGSAAGRASGRPRTLWTSVTPREYGRPLVAAVRADTRSRATPPRRGQRARALR